MFADNLRLTIPNLFKKKSYNFFRHLLHQMKKRSYYIFNHLGLSLDGDRGFISNMIGIKERDQNFKVGVRDGD